jgi:hypothetical protein
MPSTTHLALVLLSLAACEHADLATQPQSPSPSLEPAPAPAPAPVAEPAPAPEIAKPAPVTNETQLFDETLVERRCMSRAGCRWEKEGYKKPRVVKKAAPTTTTAQPEPAK